MLFSAALLALRWAAALNLRLRQSLRQHGLLKGGQDVQTSRGERTLAVGERVLFLRNDRRLGVTNGTLGTVEKVGRDRLQVRLDGPTGEARRVTVDLQRYSHLDYGYAMTVHKAQGTTADRAFVLAGPTWDRHLSYVALTRHRRELRLYYSQETFRGGEGELFRRLSRSRRKDLALDNLAQREAPRPTLGDTPPSRAAYDHLMSLPVHRRQQAADRVGPEDSTQRGPIDAIMRAKAQAARSATLTTAVPQPPTARTASHAQKAHPPLAVQREASRQTTPPLFSLWQWLRGAPSEVEQSKGQNHRAVPPAMPDAPAKAAKTQDQATQQEQVSPSSPASETQSGLGVPQQAQLQETRELYQAWARTLAIFRRGFEHKWSQRKDRTHELAR